MVRGGTGRKGTAASSLRKKEELPTATGLGSGDLGGLLEGVTCP